MRSAIRNRILQQHGHRCAICGATESLEIDHIIPVSKGGREDESNMQVLCKSCNCKKSNKIDYQQFFKIDTSPEYLEVSRSFGDLKLSAQEITNLISMMLDRHAAFWGVN